MGLLNARTFHSLTFRSAINACISFSVVRVLVDLRSKQMRHFNIINNNRWHVPPRLDSTRPLPLPLPSVRGRGFINNHYHRKE